MTNQLDKGHGWIKDKLAYQKSTNAPKRNIFLSVSEFKVLISYFEKILNK